MVELVLLMQSAESQHKVTKIIDKLINRMGGGGGGERRLKFKSSNNSKV